MALNQSTEVTKDPWMVDQLKEKALAIEKITRSLDERLISMEKGIAMSVDANAKLTDIIKDILLRLDVIDDFLESL